MPKGKLTPEQRKEAVDMYRSGKTLQEVADMYGVTRQAIGATISRKGLTGDSGGAVRRREKEREAALKEKDAIYFEKYGCGHRDYCLFVEANSMLPVYAYRSQKYNAKMRNIDWEFSIQDWWAVWDNSGQWECRGRGSEKYCMARLGDSGPYGKSNVEIISNRQNIKDVRARESLERSGGH